MDDLGESMDDLGESIDDLEVSMNVVGVSMGDIDELMNVETSQLVKTHYRAYMYSQKQIAHTILDLLNALVRPH